MQDLRNDNKRLSDCFDAIFANNTLQKPLIFSYDEVDSTNTRAKEFAEMRSDGSKSAAIFFTHAQRAGRGTRMRTFESPRDGGLYMSLLIYPENTALYATRITMLSAVSVCRALYKLTDGSIAAKIKWVNDITINDKKLAGILTEASLDEGGNTRYVIIGIGLNLKEAEHSAEVKSIMTALSEWGVEISAEELCAMITKELLSAIQDGMSDTINEYRELSSVIGRQVNVFTAAEQYQAFVSGIADDGALICIKDTGEKVSLISADVSIKIFE